jgi:hypothetical protein
MQYDHHRVPKHIRDRAVDYAPGHNRYKVDQCIHVCDEFAFLGSHKCGRTTALKTLGRGVTWAKYLSLNERPPLVVMWRDPFERLESTYRWAVRRQPHRFHVKVDEPFNYMFPPANKPFADWVAHVCKYPVDSWFDTHLKSQTWLSHGPGGERADLLLRWDWKVFEELFQVQVETHNASDRSIPAEWTLAAREAAEHTYAKDIEAWNDGNYPIPAELPPIDCGTCGACCIGLGLIGAPPDGPQVRQHGICPHFDQQARNCSIYVDRFQTCRDFDCRHSVNGGIVSPRIRAAGVRRLPHLSR